MPFWEYAAGDMNYQLKLDLPLGNNPAKLSINSDLLGTELKLPGAFAKNARQAKPVTIGFLLEDSALLPVTIDLQQAIESSHQTGCGDTKPAFRPCLIGYRPD